MKNLRIITHVQQHYTACSQLVKILAAPSKETKSNDRASGSSRRTLHPQKFHQFPHSNNLHALPPLPMPLRRTHDKGALCLNIFPRLEKPCFRHWRFAALDLDCPRAAAGQLQYQVDLVATIGSTVKN